MKNLVLALSLLVSVIAFADMPPGTSFSFKGSANLKDVKDGKLTKTIRLKDRTVAPYNYKTGLVLPLVNSDKVEEKRSEEDQVKANAYGFVKLVSAVSHVADAAELAELQKYYTNDQISAANQVATVVVFKYQANK